MRLHRSQTEMMIGGVCGGIAEELEIDPSIIRIIAVILLLAGIGLLPYIIMWIVLPSEI